jgi:hypothetical protein
MPSLHVCSWGTNGPNLRSTRALQGRRSTAVHCQTKRWVASCLAAEKVAPCYRLDDRTTGKLSIAGDDGQCPLLIRSGLSVAG